MASDIFLAVNHQMSVGGSWTAHTLSLLLKDCETHQGFHFFFHLFCFTLPLLHWWLAGELSLQEPLAHGEASGLTA